ncbi:MAG: hypothetical protein ND895_04905 [Pyrinomonadaceae bacterium]|nr:hypothetical protein [Pyrinomonadaceae bacterium]
MNYSLLAIVIVVVVAVGFFIVRRATATPRSVAAQRLDDQRFAHLLITELKLYNPHMVKLGLENKDLYHRLKSEIDRARQMYDQRVGPRAGVHPDYFHEELVKNLAEGDISNLGTDYPHKSGIFGGNNAS